MAVESIMTVQQKRIQQITNLNQAVQCRIKWPLGAVSAF